MKLICISTGYREAISMPYNEETCRLLGQMRLFDTERKSFKKNEVISFQIIEVEDDDTPRTDPALVGSAGGTE